MTMPVIWVLVGAIGYLLFLGIGWWRYDWALFLAMPFVMFGLFPPLMVTLGRNTAHFDLPMLLGIIGIAPLFTLPLWIVMSRQQDRYKAEQQARQDASEAWLRKFGA